MATNLNLRLSALAAATVAVLVSLVFTQIGFATPRTWDGGGDNINWNDGANWNPDGAPASGDALSLTTSIPVSMGIGANIGATSIDFANNFNGLNGAVIGGNSASAVTLTLDNNWSISDNATSGQVTFQSYNGGVGALSMKLNGAGAVTVNDGAQMQITNEIDDGSSAGSITKAGGGTLNLGGVVGANTYSGGTTVDAGTLVTMVDQALGSTSASLTVNGGNTVNNNFPTTLDLHGTNQTVGAFSGTAVNFVGGWVRNDLANTTSTLTVGNGDASGTYNGQILNGQGTTALTKVGSGTQTIGFGGNAYTGDTNVNAGTLTFDGPGGDAIGKMTVAAGATFNASEGGAGLSIFGLNGQGNVAVSAFSLGFNLQPSSSNTFDGVISGTGVVTVGGAGSNATQTFTGANTYQGGTNIGTGTLFVNNISGSGTGSGAVVVDTFGTLAGTGTISGAVTVGGNSGGGKISGGTTVGTLTLQNGLTFIGQMGSLATDVVDLNGLTSDKLVINGSLDLSGMFDQILFQGTTGAPLYVLATYTGALSGMFNTVTDLPDGYSLDYTVPGQIDLLMTINPIPEASTWVAAALALGAIGYFQRRQFRRRAL